MNFIDKQGKLFGKLNIIDLIAIVLIVAVAVFLGNKFLVGGESQNGEEQAVIYTVKVKNVEPDVYAFITEELEKGPSQLTASNEMLPAYVTQVEATPVEETQVLIERPADYTTVTQENKGNYDLIFTIEGTVENNLTSELGTQEIRVGKAHIVKTTTFELANGVILSCDRLESTDE